MNKRTLCFSCRNVSRTYRNACTACGKVKHYRDNLSRNKPDVKSVDDSGGYREITGIIGAILLFMVIGLFIASFV